ncbi:hypothetical protein POVWA2_035820 [Plasmodium ovale wallikeri]|uniref:Uncharacterized protein n=1 Tax=Plasmodium ovale wallikeri TaxID=864142 RepID=A0A1A8Z1U9_PLAOA|nr:hypothetical protein POVWA1_036520 [Plasmodium ovale wallikeri]SBT38434.1 hypothetical protein POVWA2_035820 [Plasmodium ovale wallikeri]
MHAYPIIHVNHGVSITPFGRNLQRGKKTKLTKMYVRDFVDMQLLLREGERDSRDITLCRPYVDHTSILLRFLVVP